MCSIDGGPSRNRAMRLSEVEKFSINKLWNSVYRSLQEATSLEAAAQLLTDACFQEFKESLILVRIFITVPYAKLPDFNQKFAREFAAKMGREDELVENTPVLSLVGTRGVEPAWNDCRQSQGHAGIPMISKTVVQTIPMISQMLKDLGLGLDWLSGSVIGGTSESRGHTGGVFLVPDAKISTDAQDRKIIPDQDFVEEYGVKTVFGNGARFALQGNDFLVSIFFTRQSLDKSIAHRFNSLLYLFKTITSHLVEAGRLYA